MMKKYTLDRIEDGMCVFLERPDEVVSVLIPRVECPVELVEGDIVTIESLNGEYKIDALNEETEVTRDKVQSLLDKLRNK